MQSVALRSQRPPSRGFTNFPLRQAVEDALGLPVAIENDGPCAALGEWLCGAGQGVRQLRLCDDLDRHRRRHRLGGAAAARAAGPCRPHRPHSDQARWRRHLLLRPARLLGGGSLGLRPAEARRGRRALPISRMPFPAPRRERQRAWPSPSAAARDIALGLAGRHPCAEPGAGRHRRRRCQCLARSGADAPRPRRCSACCRRSAASDIVPAALGDDSGLAGAAQLVLRPEYAAA